MEVTLLNIIEKVSEFTKSNDDVTITEKTVANQLIYRVPFDTFENIITQCSLNTTKTSQAAQDLFYVNAFTGNVRRKEDVKDFDHEGGKSHDLYFYLYDIIRKQVLGNQEFRLRVNILDVNDNSPVFANDLYPVSIYENATIGSFVTRVTATDKDRISSGKIRYYILSNAYGRKFAINGTSGDITLASTLDFEGHIEKFPITVCANDSTVDPTQIEQGLFRTFNLSLCERVATISSYGSW